MKYIVAKPGEQRIKSDHVRESSGAKNFRKKSKFVVEADDEDTSEEISVDDAGAMITRFKDSNPDELKYSYSIVSANYKSFLDKLRPVSADHRTKAVGLSPGRASSTGFLDFSMETIIYDIAQPGQGRNATPITGANFFGKLASQFATTDFRSANRVNMDDAVRFKETQGTEIILVEFKALATFSNPVFDELKIEFARTVTNKLTVVLSRIKNGMPLQTGTNATMGIFLDDHDLIP